MIAWCDAVSESVRIDVVAYAVLDFTAADIEVGVGEDVIYPFVGWVPVIDDVSMVVCAGQLKTVIGVPVGVSHVPVALLRVKNVALCVAPALAERELFSALVSILIAVWVSIEGFIEMFGIWIVRVYPNFPVFFGLFPGCVEVAAEDDFLVRVSILEVDSAVDCFEGLDFLFFPA